jgi:hypothetical protein
MRKEIVMAKVEITCACGTKKMVRQADLDRGWGKFCSKSCAATFRKQGTEAAAASRRYALRYDEYNRKCREERHIPSTFVNTEL